MKHASEQLQDDMLALCHELQRTTLADWQVIANTLRHDTTFGGSELTVFVNDAGQVQATCRTWVIHYLPFGAALYKYRTVFEIAANSLPELRQQLAAILRPAA